MIRPVGAMLAKLYDVFVACDAMLVEVNPLIVTADREVTALDAKVSVDDNALGRQPEIAEMRNPSAEDPQEQMAKERGVTYVKLDGEVGILGNGAGLVMSTLDVVAQAGGAPGELPRRGRRREGGGDRRGARGAAVRQEGEGGAVQHLRRHHALRRGRERGILQALDQIEVKVPIVVRLDGTNDEEGRRILAEADAPQLHPAKTMLEAADMVVELAKGRQSAVGSRQIEMAILVDDEHQAGRAGPDRREGSFHGLRNREYGTDLVAGVTPGKGGQDVEGVPVSTRCTRRSPRPAPTRRWCSCLRRSPPTRSTRPPTRASRRSSASPRASRRTTCCGSTTTSRARTRA